MSETAFSKILRELAADWAKQAEKAEQQGRQLSVGNIQQAYYHRGISEGLRRAQASLIKLLDVPDQADTNTETIEAFAAVNRETVLRVITEAGFKIHDLHSHSDYSYSLILSPLQALTYADSLQVLAAMPDIIILAHGRLPNSNKAYIDFAFRSLPQP